MNDPGIGLSDNKQSADDARSKSVKVLEKFEEIANQLKEKYAKAKPYSHCCIDGLFPKSLLQGVIGEVPKPESNQDWIPFEQEGRAHNKVISSVEGLNHAGEQTKQLLSILTSSRFIRSLETLSGIRGLMLDPHFYNSGFHQMSRGGFLKIHRDFFYHHELSIYRRVNIILYLNEDWKEEYGGYLELCDEDLENSVMYYPFNNRLVISNVTADALHGNPAPLACPEDRTRISFALWYFTSQMPREELLRYELASNSGWYDKNSLTKEVKEPLIWTIIPPVVRDFFFRPLAVIIKFTPPIIVHALSLMRRWRTLAELKRRQAVRPGH